MRIIWWLLYAPWREERRRLQRRITNQRKELVYLNQYSVAYYERWLAAAQECDNFRHKEAERRRRYQEITDDIDRRIIQKYTTEFVPITKPSNVNQQAKG